MTEKVNKNWDIPKIGIVIGVVALMGLVYFNMFMDNTPKDNSIYEDVEIIEPSDFVNVTFEDEDAITKLINLFPLMLGFIIIVQLMKAITDD